MGALKTAVLIPCYNEAVTIAKVVRDFKRELPEADIYVYDNNSTDGSADLAREAGAIVRHEYKQGKGFVLRSMFNDIEADCYIMVDADDTYPAESAPEMERMLDGLFLLCRGSAGYHDRRPGHEPEIRQRISPAGKGL